MSAVCFGFTHGEEAQVRKVFFIFFLKHISFIVETYVIYFAEHHATKYGPVMSIIVPLHPQGHG